MVKFIYFTPEEKARAQNTDLVSLLRAQGERPIRSGREYRTPNDPSVTIRGNKWFDHSKREGGYAISFVQRYYRLPYPEAVLLLLGRKDGRTLEQAKPAATEPKPFALPEPYSNMRRVYAYLLHKRHIEREVVSYFTHEKLLYEDEHHNCVFVGMDGDIAKHAHLRSTNSEGKVFRMNVEGSESAHSFHKDGTDKSLYVFEAPIDLLSHITLYMDLAVANPEDMKSRAKSEKYAKILSNTIINPSGDESIYGQNSYFYQAAEGVLTATILLLAEHLPPTKEQPEERRHIVSVFKLVQELLAPIGSGPKAKNGFQFLMAMMPEDHKARWFSGSALTTAEQSMNSVMSTVLSRLNAFLDSELEQVLCFDNVIDAERMAREKCAVFLILPEEDVTKHFMASLIVQALSQELFYVADKNGGKLPRRVIFFMDEFGTMPPFNVLPLFSAGRSRGLTLMPIIQSLAQLEKNYGKEGAAIIQDNCQTTIFGGFAPSSQTAEVLSKALGTRTVLSGSVSQGKESSQSLQMMERPLLSADELKSLPKGEFIVMKTGTHPMQTHLQLFLDWGIAFGEEYRVPEHGARKVAYANKEMLMKVIRRKYPPAAGKTPSSSEAEASGGKSAPAREEVQQEMIAAAEGAKRRAYNTPKAEDTT